MPDYTNYYRCSVCHTEWTDQWSCTCNDRCPHCNAEIEPYKSEDTVVMTTQIKDLITRCQETEASIALDDIVHDLKSQEASAINNGGVKAQIDYIIQVYGEEAGIKKIEDTIS